MYTLKVCPKTAQSLPKVCQKYDQTMPKVNNLKLTMHHLRRVFLWLYKVRGILRVGRLVSFDWVSIKKQKKKILSLYYTGTIKV